MEHSASAPAMPAANRKAVRTLGQIGVCALILQAAATTVLASETRDGAGTVETVIDSALLAAAPAEKLMASLYFEPVTAVPAALAVLSEDVRIAPIAQPVAKPAAVNAAVVKPARRTAALPSQAGTNRLFGVKGRPVGLTPVTRSWERALGSIRADKGKSGRKSFRAYSAILDQVKDSPRHLQIPKINYMVNRLLSYREDHRLWNAREYWASPQESLKRRAGDCEDYAILKYSLLRDLGVADKDMRIVVIRDTAARQYHAVLSVREKGSWKILDNRFSRVRSEKDLPHYTALYSVNASGAWAHSPMPKKSIRLAARLKALAQ